VRRLFQLIRRVVLIAPGRQGEEARRRLSRGLLGLGVALTFSAAVCTRVAPRGLRVEVGEPSPRTVLSPRDTQFEDEDATRQAIEQAKSNTPKQYDSAKTEAQSAMEADLDAVWAAVRACAGRQEGTPAAEREPDDELAQALKQRGLDISLGAMRDLVRRTPGELQTLRARGREVIRREALESETRDDEPEAQVAARKRMAEACRSVPGSTGEALGEVVSACFRPNMRYNEAATRAAVQLAQEQVERHMISIKERERVIEEGQIVDDLAYEKLSHLGLLQEHVDYLQLAYTATAAALSVLLFGLMFRCCVPELWANSRALWAVAGTVVGGTLITNLALAPSRSIEGVAVVMAASQAIGVMCFLLFGSLPALLVIGIVSVAAAMVGGNSLLALLTTSCAGLVGVLIARGTTGSALTALRLGIGGGASNLAAVLVVRGLFGSEALATGGWAGLGVLAEWTLIPGIGAVLMGQLGARVLEGPLQILTDMRLLELSDPRQPLLHEMMRRAPGTYHSSLQVAALAGDVAEQLAMNDLLVRVGAMYHDIGKLRYPHFFAENQFGGPNPHASLTPSMSALVLISHVKEGLERGRAAKLPVQILDFIAQHHGTNLIEYFYHQACDAEGAENVPEERFRYPGPRPRSRETAIVMLADSVEAAVRSMREPTHSKIDSMVRGIVRSRVEQGQLSESPLTLRDIDTAIETLVRALQGIHHTRVEYPGDAELLRSAQAAASAPEAARADRARGNGAR